MFPFCHLEPAAASTSARTMSSAAFNIQLRQKCLKVRFKRNDSDSTDTEHSQRSQFIPRNFIWNPKLNQTFIDAIKNEGKLLAVRTQSLLETLVNQLERTVSNKNSEGVEEERQLELELDCLVEQSLDATAFVGKLSPAAIFSIEQFSRLNGLTGRKVQIQFELSVPKDMHNNARSLVEYCCFSYLSRNVLDVDPRLKDSAFRQLLFITMQAWQKPYVQNHQKDGDLSRRMILRNMVISEEAFVRIAPAIAGLADRATAHHIYRALVGDKNGLYLDIWDAYISELLRVRNGREVYRQGEGSKLDLAFDEHILCIGASKYPVLKWDNNTAWPGRLTLTDRALYFEVNMLSIHQKALRFGLAIHDARVEKAKVGPFGLHVFDTGLCISSSSKSETWTLEFVDLEGQNRRDIWYAFMKEIISVHRFIDEYGPEENDPSMAYVYGSRSGKSKAMNSAVNAIARLQCLYSMQGVNIGDPILYVPFCHLSDVAGGELVYQAMAVELWGGYLEKSSKEIKMETENDRSETKVIIGHGPHAIGSDGSIYLRKWMKSSSWDSGESITFWKNCSRRKGITFGKNLVVGDRDIVEKAVLHCRMKNKLYEKTQATIDAALLKGIPSNIDLFKELMLPIAYISTNLRKLIYWENPLATICFLAVAYTIIFRNWLHYIVPSLLISTAISMLILNVLREHGKLEKNFGKVTIKEKPPLNTIQKIVGLRDALDEIEQHLQKLNVILLKLRTIFISGNTQVSYKVAFTFLAFGMLLISLPFRYVCALVLLDLFTRELAFRKKMIVKFLKFVKEQWAAIPAAPVVVLPHDDAEKFAVDEMTDKRLADDRKDEEGPPQ
eukprot:TRINITY_DN11769_c0_g1_i1.p1 TRINITY_DN11769_c0_g1~~TRINITY_DN11769_c0_g1_i1.p1  ORF type:complete len:839 (-),score=162.79 TRINITY_DN11769_c0_g1_i1:88-2604(-)